jgi:antibiotic biosynthesis monooxygenase (ABM) superfamily enzyme
VEVRVSRASAVIVQRVPAAAAERFLEWQRGVTAVAEGFAGYRATDVYPPAEAGQDEWVVVIHFDTNDALQAWLNSPARADWLARLRAELGDFQLTTLPGGFAAWFTGLSRGPDGAAPPGWKMALTVLLGLYPTVMLLTIFPGKYTKGLGLAVSMLIGNALSVALLQWAVMPVLNPLVAPWFKANADRQRTISIAGLVLILLLLGVLTLAFRAITG